MSARTRVQIWIALGVAAVLAASLTAVLPGQVVAANAASTVTAPTCGKIVHRKPDGTAWRCTFGDDFNGTSLNTSKWHVTTSTEFNMGKRPDCFVNRPANVSVSDGALKLTSRIEKTAMACKRGRYTYQTRYTSGMVTSYDRYMQTYGRFEFRAKFPYTTQHGVQSSAWLWPKSVSWPASGEIDVAEWYSNWPDRVIPYLHFGTSFLSPGGVTNNYCYVNRVQDWHTYVVVWTKKVITFSYDGKQCLRSTAATGDGFAKPHMLAMFQAFGVKRNVPTSTTPAVSRAQFAWVRAWS